jgi:predicted extracellular nuclease
VPTLTIHDLQGNGELSPVAGALVQTQGIVTAVRGNGFNLQTAPGDEDADPATSEGILVFTGAAPPAAAAVGNRVQVSGTVIEFRSSSNPHQGFITEITSPTVTLLSAGNALPAPIEITAALANPAGPVEALERLEAMRVSIASAVSTGPGEGFIDENDALSTANGVFWAVVEGVDRPFREAGVGVRDVTPGIPVNTPRFDTNPERIRVQSTGQVGAPVIAVDAGATVTGLVGVLDYGFGTYNLLPDPSAPVVVTGGAVPSAVAEATVREITIAGFNLLRFYDDVDDAGGDVPLTALAFERRLRKTANAICEYVKLPDILGAVEVENLNALQRLADAINTNVPGTCARNPQYVAYLQEGNDVGKINIGYLVSTVEVSAGVPRVSVVEVIQHGKTGLISNPNGSTSTLYDRPPLVLRAVVNASNGSSVPVTVIGNHLLSLIDINSLAPGSNGYATTGDRRRAKRGLQAQDTAALIEQYQQANPSERIVLLGDFNAFEFSDGYVDLMGILTGREATADAVLAYFDSAITTPLTNMTGTSAPTDRYSFSFEGSAQSLDHMVVNQALLDGFAGARIEHARINADFGTDNFGDDNVPLRVSDHDPVVLYLGDDSFLTSDLSIVVSAAAPSVVAGTATSFQSTLSNSGPDTASSVLVRFTADAELASVAVTPPAGFVCGAPVIGGGQTVVECAAAELAAGSVAFGVVAVTSPFQTGALTLTATVESLSTDLNPGNNVGTAIVTLAAPIADLHLQMVEKPATQVFAREATLGLQVRNRGPDASQTPQLAVVIAAGTSALTAEPAPGWSCPISSATSARTTFLCSFTGAYAHNRSDILRFKVRALKSTVVNVSANVASPTLDPVSLNNTAALRFTVGLSN